MPHLYCFSAVARVWVRQVILCFHNKTKKKKIQTVSLCFPLIWYEGDINHGMIYE